MGILRVTAEEEMEDLNMAKQGERIDWLDTINAMSKVIKNGDFTQRVPEENGTEAGQVALMFNALMERMQIMVSDLETLCLTPPINALRPYLA